MLLPPFHLMIITKMLSCPQYKTGITVMHMTCVIHGKDCSALNVLRSTLKNSFLLIRGHSRKSRKFKMLRAFERKENQKSGNILSVIFLPAFVDAVAVRIPPSMYSR